MKDHNKEFIVNCIIVSLAWAIIAAILIWGINQAKEIPPVREKPNSMAMISGNSLMGVATPAFYRIESLGCRVITAYTSSEDETDSTPFITASGQRTRKGIVATNELSFGVTVEIDGGIYEVQDRTNPRYKHLIDIWMETKEEAFEFGRQIKEVNIIY